MSLFLCEHIGPKHEMLVPNAPAGSEDSGEPMLMHRLTRALSALLYNVCTIYGL